MKNVLYSLGLSGAVFASGGVFFALGLSYASTLTAVFASAIILTDGLAAKSFGIKFSDTTFLTGLVAGAALLMGTLKIVHNHDEPELSQLNSQLDIFETVTPNNSYNNLSINSEFLDASEKNSLAKINLTTAFDNTNQTLIDLKSNNRSQSYTP